MIKAYLTKTVVIDTAKQHVLYYSRPLDICEGFPTGKLCNMAAGYPYEAFGVQWRSTEHLYLCGRWSRNTEEDIFRQNDLRSATSGYAAKIFKRNKYMSVTRPDFYEFRHEWMLWCVWQKCIGNADYRKLLLSLPKDVYVAEVVEKDPVWAMRWTDSHTLSGANGMGKILMICRDALQENREPDIDIDYLNNCNIYILGQKLQL